MLHYFLALLIPFVLGGVDPEAPLGGGENPCLGEGEGSCTIDSDLEFGQVSEVRCELGLCCDPSSGDTCVTLDTLGSIVGLNLTFNPTLQCANISDFCRGTIFDTVTGEYCSCRQNCEQIGTCCFDANETCADTWNTIDFCEEIEGDTFPTEEPIYDNGCCSGFKKACKRRHWEKHCEHRGCNWDTNKAECQLQCCAKIPGERRPNGAQRCRSLTPTECNGRADCQPTLCDAIGAENDEGGKPFNPPETS